MNVVNTVAVVIGSFQDTTSFNTVKTIMYLHINIEWHNCVFQLENILGKMTSFYINNGKVAGNCRHRLITPGEPSPHILKTKESPACGEWSHQLDGHKDGHFRYY